MRGRNETNTSGTFIPHPEMPVTGQVFPTKYKQTHKHQTQFMFFRGGGSSRNIGGYKLRGHSSTDGMSTGIAEKPTWNMLTSSALTGPVCLSFCAIITSASPSRILAESYRMTFPFSPPAIRTPDTLSPEVML